MKLVQVALLAGICGACGTSTTDTAGDGTAGGSRGTTSVGNPSTGGTSTAGTTSSGTTTAGTTAAGTTSNGTTTAGTTSNGTTTAGTTTTGSSTGGSSTAGASTGGSTTYKLWIQTFGGAPGTVTVQNEQSETLTFTGDGNQAFSHAYVSGDSFTLSNLTASHAHRACTATTASGQIAKSDVYVTVNCVWQAVRVLGQADFSGHAGNQVTGSAPGPNTMQSPTGNPVVGGGNVLFIADTSNNRILAYISAPSANNANANFQLGQSSFTVSNPAPSTSSSGFHAPSAVATNGARFAVVDTDNNRVLLYSAQPQQTGNANFVFTGPTDCDSRGLYITTGAAWDGNKLIVADSHNARVLIYSNVPTNATQAPDIILGQPAPSTNQSTYCTSTYPVGPNSIYSPASVAFDGTRLIVTDTGDNRVMIWNSLPTQTNQAADVIVGQLDGTSQKQSAGFSGMTRPLSAVAQGNRLFVADSTNNRVLYWNTFPTRTGTPADGSFGWASPAVSNVTCAAASSSTLCAPTGIAVYGGYIFIVDTSNHRVLMFADDLI